MKSHSIVEYSITSYNLLKIPPSSLAFLARQTGAIIMEVPLGFEPRTSRTPIPRPGMPSQCLFGCSLDDVIALGTFLYCLRASSLELGLNHDAWVTTACTSPDGVSVGKNRFIS